MKNDEVLNRIKKHKIKEKEIPLNYIYDQTEKNLIGKYGFDKLYTVIQNERKIQESNKKLNLYDSRKIVKIDQIKDYCIENGYVFRRLDKYQGLPDSEIIHEIDTIFDKNNMTYYDSKSFVISKRKMFKSNLVTKGVEQSSLFYKLDTPDYETYLYIGTWGNKSYNTPPEIFLRRMFSDTIVSSINLSLIIAFFMTFLIYLLPQSDHTFYSRLFYTLFFLSMTIISIINYLQERADFIQFSFIKTSDIIQD